MKKFKFLAACLMYMLLDAVLTPNYKINLVVFESKSVLLIRLPFLSRLKMTLDNLILTCYLSFYFQTIKNGRASKQTTSMNIFKSIYCKFSLFNTVIKCIDCVKFQAKVP